MNRRNNYSRLRRKEETRIARRASLFILLTIAILAAIAYFGLPAFVKLMVLWGELRNKNTPVEITDKTPPPPPQVLSLPRAVKDNRLSVEGYTEPGAQVEILKDGAVAGESIAEEDGRFLITIELSEGAAMISAMASDQAGNRSQPSKEIEVVFDPEPPELEIYSPSEESLSVNKNSVLVIGKATPESTLLVGGRLTILGKEGDFEQTVSLAEGENEVKITAEDEAGNKTEKTFWITYTP